VELNRYRYNLLPGTIGIAVVILTCLIFGNFPSPATGQGKFAFKNKVNMTFVDIPAGTFLMGSPSNEMGRESDEKLHQVTISKGFYMSATEVTQRQWEKVMGFNPAGYNTLGNDYPVEQVSWHDCQEFIKQLNKLEKTNKYRLPTEAEWEYACRANSSSAFTGDIEISRLDCVSQPALDSMAWYCANSNLMPQPVANKKPNAFGLYDMHGNVHEWCLDSCTWYDIWSREVNVITETYKNGIVDPVSKEGNLRVFRGGSYLQNQKYCRSADRNAFGSNERRTYIGFRVIKIK